MEAPFEDPKLGLRDTLLSIERLVAQEVQFTQCHHDLEDIRNQQTTSWALPKV